MSTNFPNRFQEAINTPVDIEAEIKAYEEEQARKTGEPLDQEPDVEDSPDPEAEPSVSEPESKPDADGEIEAKPKHPGGAWQTMRAKVRAAEEEVRQVREEMARREGEQRAWQTYQQQIQQQQQYAPQEEAIDPTVNPIEAVQRLQADAQQMREYIQQQQLISQVQQAYKADAERFMASKIDFREAYTHALNARSRQLQIAGATAQQASEQVHREELELAYTALQQGKSPAQVIYEMAGAYGYVSGAQPAQTPRDAQGRFTTIDQQAKKNAAATSISPGGTPPARDGLLPIEEAVKLNGKQFDEWYEKAKGESKTKGKISW